MMYLTDIFTVLQRSTTGVKSSLLFLCALPRRSPTEGTGPRQRGTGPRERGAGPRHG